MKNQKAKLKLFELTLFAMYGALMYATKLLMEALPNIHLIGMFIVLFTAVYRKKALIPIYVYVFLDGLFSGFTVWWVPYLYIWTILWGTAMLVPKDIPKTAAMIIYPLICALHGFLFGTLYAPFQALVFGFNLKQTVAWIVSGLPFDAVHGISNFASGFLVYPLSLALKKAGQK